MVTIGASKDTDRDTIKESNAGVIKLLMEAQAKFNDIDWDFEGGTFIEQCETMNRFIDIAFGLSNLIEQLNTFHCEVVGGKSLLGLDYIPTLSDVREAMEANEKVRGEM